MRKRIEEVSEELLRQVGPEELGRLLYETVYERCLEKEAERMANGLPRLLYGPGEPVKPMRQPVVKNAILAVRPTKLALAVARLRCVPTLYPLVHEGGRWRLVRQTATAEAKNSSFATT